MDQDRPRILLYLPELKIVSPDLMVVPLSLLRRS
jgi:hypothetical protein